MLSIHSPRVDLAKPWHVAILVSLVDRRCHRSIGFPGGELKPATELPWVWISS